MALPPRRVLSLASGCAGLDHGLRRAEPTARAVCYVEVEAFVAAALVAQMQEGLLAEAPVWSDLRTFDGRRWRGAVDLVVAGFPCQDISSAGKRAGILGSRSALWFHVARVFRESGARALFLENVDDLVIRGLDAVLWTLAEQRATAAWGVLSAAQVGASHERKRWWCLAVADPHRGAGGPADGLPGFGRRENEAEPSGLGSRHVADAECEPAERWGGAGDVPGTPRNAGRAPREQRDGDAAGDCGEAVAHADDRGLGPHDGRLRQRQPNTGRHGSLLGEPSGAGLEGSRSREPLWAAGHAAPEPAGESLADASSERCREARRDRRGLSEWFASGLPLFPPGPADLRAWRAVPAGLEPAVCRLADGVALADRTDWLRLLGNGVVPDVAAEAYRQLRSRLVSEGVWPWPIDESEVAS